MPVTIGDANPAVDEGSRQPGTDASSERWARGTFIVVMAGAVVFYLWSDRHAWFAFDEWDFLSGRSAGSISSLLRPHNEHWSTLPILLWRALFHLFGLGSYTPYLLALLLAHLCLAVLIRVVMRRAGVRPWTATIAASLFLLLGSGSDDILWAFQIGFVGALVFGFVQLLLADHDGPIGGRDAVALTAGLAALLCSGVGVTMVVVVGIATWTRRGWRPAAVQTAPLAAAYLLWWSIYARNNYHEQVKLREAPKFIVTMVATTFRDLSQLPYLGFALAALLIAGLYLSWRGLPRADLRRCASVPGALLAGGLVFLIITSIGRAASIDDPLTPPRYAYVVAALILPALAVAIDAVGRRLGTWGMLLPIVFLVAIPGNLRIAAERDGRTAQTYQELRLLMLSAAHLPVSSLLPADEIPAQLFTGPTTVGWLRSNAAAGRVPSPGRLSLQQQADLTQQLVLVSATPSSTSHCRPLAIVDGRADVTSHAGSYLVVPKGGTAEVTYLPPTGPRPSPKEVGGTWNGGVRFVVSNLRFQVRPARSGEVLACP